MSQQNANDTSQTKDIEKNQEEVAVAGAISRRGEPQPVVFKLNTDCWDEVLNFLSLEDVHSFGQTCKAFQRVTGQYFQWKYEAVLVHCKNDGIYIDDKSMSGFSEFVQMICFDEFTDNSVLRYVESKCKAVKRLDFISVDFHQLDFALIDTILRKLEVLEIVRCKFDEDNFGALFESCANLKRITFCGYSYPFAWLQKHPKLEHLGLITVALKNDDELETFLKLSPNLRSIEISSILFLENRDTILKAVNVQLNDLAIFSAKNTNTDIISLLMELHQRGFYKRLHLTSIYGKLSDQFLTLPGLVSLYNPSDTNFGNLVLPKIKELGVRGQWNPASIDEFNTNAWINHFINIERLAIRKPNFNAILSVVRHLVKLRDIRIYEFKENVLDIFALNNERKKLKSARKVTIYVDEHVYLATKWEMADTTFELIELKRKASHSINRPHNFLEFLNLDLH